VAFFIGAVLVTIRWTGDAFIRCAHMDTCLRRYDSTSKIPSEATASPLRRQGPIPATKWLTLRWSN